MSIPDMDTREHPNGSTTVLHHNAVTVTVNVRRNCGHYYAGDVRFNADPTGVDLAHRHGAQILTYTACNRCKR